MSITSITGALLILFLVHHALGAMLIWLGKNTFNDFSIVLLGHPAIYVARIILTVIFIVHIYFSFTASNRKSFYFKEKAYTGLIIFFFVFYHVFSINNTQGMSLDVNGNAIRDLASVMEHHFSSLLTVFLTVIGTSASIYHISGQIKLNRVFFQDKSSDRYIDNLRYISVWVIAFGLGLSLYKFSLGGLR